MEIGNNKESLRVVAVVQARMGSKRFPGKVLYEVQGKPLLQYLLERLKKCSSLDKVIVATTDQKEDDSIASFCRLNKILCFRGSSSNVAERFYHVIGQYEPQVVVRVCADSPLLDQNIIEQGLRLFFEQGVQIVTNVLERTFPRGESVEIFSADLFLQAFHQMSSAHHFEHVTAFFYENGTRFSIYNFRATEDQSEFQLAVDTKEDAETIETIVSQMTRPHWDYHMKEILALYKKVERVALPE